MSTPPPISRPTKYRAWTGSELVTVQSLCFNDKGCLWYGPGTHMGWAFLWPNATWTADDPKPSEGDLKPVMQWTGLTDKNGVDLYEGDIVTWLSGKIGTGGYDTHYFKVCHKQYAGFSPTLSSLVLEIVDPTDPNRQFVQVCGMTGSDGYSPTQDIEIVGNVHANPELLVTPKLRTPRKTCSRCQRECRIDGSCYHFGCIQCCEDNGGHREKIFLFGLIKTGRCKMCDATVIPENPDILKS